MQVRYALSEEAAATASAAVTGMHGHKDPKSPQEVRQEAGGGLCGL